MNAGTEWVKCKIGVSLWNFDFFFLISAMMLWANGWNIFTVMIRNRDGCAVVLYPWKLLHVQLDCRDRLFIRSTNCEHVRIKFFFPITECSFELSSELLLLAHIVNLIRLARQIFCSSGRKKTLLQNRTFLYMLCYCY